MSSRFSDMFRDARKRYKIGREKPQLWDFPEYGFGYIQIPKVATRSIRASLSELPAKVEASSFADFESTYSSHVEKAVIRRRVDDGLFVFAFVRDPFTRLYSAWQNKVNRPEDALGRNIFSCHGVYDHMPFDAFARRVCELDDRQVDRHLRSQSWFLCDESGVIPNWIGKLENFSDDWNALQKKFPVLQPVPHRNKTSSQEGRLDAFDPALMSLVAERYRKDFELFDYPVPVCSEVSRVGESTSSRIRDEE